MQHEPALPTDIGHLLKEPVIIDCPACQHRGLSRLREEVVTIPQMISFCINKLFCGFNVISWSGRYDYNHYCCECGCYIGRYFNFNKYARSMMHNQRIEVEENYRKNMQTEAVNTSSTPVKAANIGPAASTPLAPITHK